MSQPIRLREGMLLEMNCSCGRQKFEVRVGAAKGWGEIRTVVAKVGCKDGITREYEGRAVFLPNGEYYWIDYPDFDDFVNMPRHEDEPDAEG